MFSNNFSNDMSPHEARTYTINHTPTKLGFSGQIEENTHYQKVKPAKSKMSTTTKKRNANYSSGSVHDLNSSSADEWIDLEDDEDIDSDTDQQNSSKLITSSAAKPGLNAHHIMRTQNFVR